MDNIDITHNNIENEQKILLKNILEYLVKLKKYGQPDAQVKEQLLKYIKEHLNLDIATVFKLADGYKQQDNCPPEHSYLLGYLNNYGLGTFIDTTLAFKLYEKTALAGVPYGQARLGYCYDKRIGTLQNFNEAFCWYKLAAEQNNLAAQCLLASYYGNGYGTNKDLEKSVYWYTRAAEAGQPNAQYALARRYMQGVGVERNQRRGFLWFKIYSITHQLGNAYSYFDYAKCFKDGLGTMKDVHECLRVYRRAFLANEKERVMDHCSRLFKIGKE
ncbi:6772_t:CDS:1 [Ambispora gerdemannii]|uniref:6772_t:CDS:1 n=1 Tax=Ambispora gerdemannii TaxID=144530 RepID=A0A9N9G8K7_9GLOM|nr:6772_t:CDS:1 [Ambispora gerdemannii]